MGDAELMLEASFCDLRHGGDGDPRKAYALSKKDADTSASEWDQPFPDSWIATTAPIALGLLTDVASELALERDDGREKLWPLIAAQYRKWTVGLVPTSTLDGSWRPCEALVRIACQETWRFPARLAERLDSLPGAAAKLWASDVLAFLSDIIAENAQREKNTHRELLRAKKQALIYRRGIEVDDSEFEDDEDEVEIIETPYGMGEVKEKRTWRARNAQGSSEVRLITNVVKLEFGGTLYQPVIHASLPKGDGIVSIPSEVSGECFSFSFHTFFAVPTREFSSLASFRIYV
jgi:hypothetical protein